MGVRSKIFHGFMETLRSDKNSIYYVLYYTVLEGILVLSIPLTSSFVINSLIAHSYISLFTLGAIILTVFLFIVFLRILQEYIIEKFEQRIFVTEGYDVARKTFKLKSFAKTTHEPIDKLMNYFFDITTIQKVFPVIILNGTGLMVQTIITLVLLLIFDITLFIWAFVAIVVALFLILYFGKNGIKYAVERSDAKHNTIHFMQKLPNATGSKESVLEEFEYKMNEYVDARKRQYGVRIKQLSLSFILQGVIITGFFLLGGHLVINGSMPVGEFVAAEIVIVTLIYAINGFAKQLDYIYDGIEGFYKIGKLSASLSSDDKGDTQHA